MLATADCTNHYSEQIVYESEWTESIPINISWLNLLTAQPIPEETDAADIPYPTERVHSKSNYSSSSSSSVESCYVVLEIQRPRSIDQTSSKHEDDDDEIDIEQKEEEEEEEEEEEIEEEIEEINFAQMNHDDHDVHHDQLAMSMTTETPIEEYAVEYSQKLIPVEEFAQISQPIILETPNDILFHKAKALSRFTKRVKAMSYLSTKEQQFSTSSDDESLSFRKLKTIRKINEYHPSTISTVTAEQKTNIEPLNASPCSTASFDSIEDKCLPPSPVRTRITTTFSNLSSTRLFNSAHQNQRLNPTMGTTTLTRTFAFDRTCMEKYVRGKGQTNEPIEFQIKSVYQTPINEEQELSTQSLGKPEISLPSDDSLNYRSFNNTISTPFYIVNNPNVIDESEGERHLSITKSSSSILCSMKKYARTISSEYRLSKTNENTFNEPTLLQVKYFDGRRPLKNDHARESFRIGQTLSDSISTRLNRLGLTKVSSTQDLTSPTTSFNMSYRKRMLNRFRTFIENNSLDDCSSSSSSSTSSHIRPWQHKTVTELYNERKTKHNRST